MKHKFKLALATASFVAMMGIADQAKAVDQDIEASIITRAALAVANVVNMDFGSVEFAAVNSGTVRLGTNGTVDLVGATGLTLGADPTAAGSFDLSGDGNSMVEVRCETGGTLTDDDDGSRTLTLSAVEIAIDTGAAGGAATPCAGLTAPAAAETIDLSVTATPTILIGASLDVTADPIDGSFTYSTTNTGGDPVVVRAVYQ